MDCEICGHPSWCHGGGNGQRCQGVWYHNVKDESTPNYVLVKADLFAECICRGRAI